MTILRYFITSKAKRNLLKFFFTNSDGSFYTRQVARLTGEPLNAVRRELGYLEKAGLLHSHMEGNQKYYGIVSSFPQLSEWKEIVLESDVTTNPPRTTFKASEEIISSSLSPVTEETGKEEITDAVPIVQGAEVVMYLENGSCASEMESLQEESAIPSLEVTPLPAPADRSVLSFVEYLRGQFAGVNSIALAVIYGDAAKSEDIPDTGIDLLMVGDVNKNSLLELIANIEDKMGVRINLTRMTRSDLDYRNAKGDPLIRHIWSEKKLVVKGRHNER